MSPGLLDDVILKRKVLDGMFRAAKHEAQEAEKRGMLKDVADLDAELHDAYLVFKAKLEYVIDETKNRVTKKVIP
jgi:hypothetical protein